MRILPVLFISLAAIACNSSTEQSKPGQTDHTHLLEKDTSLAERPDTASLPTDDELQHYAPDTTDLTPEPGTAAKIMIEGRFHKHEVWQGAEHKPWLALVQEDSVFRLQPAQLRVSLFHDPVLDKGRQVKSGREVRSEHPNTLLFLTGIHKLKAGTVDTVGYASQVILPNTTLTLRFKDNSYTLAASGDSIQQEGSESYSVQNYSWTVSGMRNGRKVTQQLATDTDFESAIYVLLWAGDLDRDGIPDLLADLSNHYNTSKVTLFLSSLAEKGKLYKRVATFSSEAYPTLPAPDSLAKP
jgi:hypothetical protein